MRIFVLFTLFITLFSGCTHTTAFDFFKMDKDHERTMTSLHTTSIVRSFETEAMISTIYLNEVYPKEYHDAEYFFTALYMNNDKRLFYKDTLKNPEYSLKLNGIKPESIKILDKDSKLRRLMPIKNEWNRYYLIKYPLQKANTLTLVLENDRSLSATIRYQKDEE